MSRHFAAYFAIVGTLAFAPSGAANAGPFNMPHFNMLRPQPHFNMPQPHISMPTPHLSNMPTPHLSNSQNKKINNRLSRLPGPTGQPVTQQQSATGTTSAMLVSNVSGGTNGGGTTPSRFRVIEDGGHFAVVERRSEKIVAGGFESYKAASAWIANHV